MSAITWQNISPDILKSFSQRCEATVKYKHQISFKEPYWKLSLSIRLVSRCSLPSNDRYMDGCFPRDRKMLDFMKICMRL